MHEIAGIYPILSVTRHHNTALLQTLCLNSIDIKRSTTSMRILSSATMTSKGSARLAIYVLGLLVVSLLIASGHALILTCQQLCLEQCGIVVRGISAPCLLENAPAGFNQTAWCEAACASYLPGCKYNCGPQGLAYCECLQKGSYSNAKACPHVPEC